MWEEAPDRTPTSPMEAGLSTQCLRGQRKPSAPLPQEDIPSSGASWTSAQGQLSYGVPASTSKVRPAPTAEEVKDKAQPLSAGMRPVTGSGRGSLVVVICYVHVLEASPLLWKGPLPPSQST